MLSISFHKMQTILLKCIGLVHPLYISLYKILAVCNNHLLHQLRRYGHYTITGSFLVYFSACQDTKEYIQPQYKDIIISVYGSGKTLSHLQYDVYPSIQGLIKDIYIKEGDTLYKNDLIALIDNDEAKLTTENAQLVANYNIVANQKQKLSELINQAEISRTKLLNDSIMYARQSALWQKGIGSKSDLDNKALMYYTSQKNYENTLINIKEFRRQIAFNDQQSKTSLSLSKTKKKNFEIRNTLDKAIVYALHNRIGEMAILSMPIATIGAADSFYVEITFDEYDLSKVKIGQKVWLRFDSYKDTVFEAKIAKINPYINEKSKSFIAEAQFIGIPSVLVPNMSFEANVEVEHKAGALTIPSLYIDANRMVTLGDGTKKAVGIGLSNYLLTEITQGLDTSETIILPQ